VRQFLARSGDLAPWAREQMGSRLLSELAARAAPPPPGMEPGVYFAAVLAERRHRELERAAPPSVSPPPAAPPSAPAPSPAAKPPSASAPPEGPFAPPA
jgi:hypothetical protein